MSRSNYVEDCWDSAEDQWRFICYRGAVNSALRGRRGQQFLREMLEAIDSLPEKKLIAHELEHEGEYCALGAVGRSRAMNMEELDPENYDQLAEAFGIAPSMVREIEFVNDDDFGFSSADTPENRWRNMRHWIARHLEDSAG